MNNEIIDFNKKHRKLLKHNTAFIYWLEKLKEYQAYQIASQECQAIYDIISIAYGESLATNDCYITRIQNNPLETFINNNNSKSVRNLFETYDKQDEFILKVKLIKSFMDLIAIEASHIVINEIKEDQLGIYTFKKEIDGWDNYLFSERLYKDLKLKKQILTKEIKL